MRGQISGTYSSSNDVVSIPRVDDEQASPSSSESTISGDIEQYVQSGSEYEAEDSYPHTSQTSPGSRFGALLSGVFGSSAGAFSVFNTTISDVLRVSPKITSAVMSIVAALLISVGGIAVYDSFNQPTPALWVGAEDDCAKQVRAAKTSDTDALSDVGDDLEAQKLERGKKIYSVLKVYNPSMSNEHIAAILSNWEWESGGLDETSIEGVSDEPYHMGLHKEAVMKNMDSYTRGFAGSSYYFEPDGKGRCGIGLAQETGPNHKAMVEAAEGMGHKWYEFDWQLAYVIAQGATPTGDKDFFGQGHFSSQGGGLDALCDYFTVKFEGIPGGQEHRQYASTWLSRMGSWEIDRTYADSIIQMMNNMGVTASAQEVEKQKSKCPPCASENDDKKYDNSGIAQAAASLSWPTHDQAAGTPTEVYRKVLPGVFNGDTYYLACDRVALAAVRWSGADDDFPSITTNQIPHMTTSPIWEKVADSPSESQLQPGDVLIYDNGGGANGHVFIYTGHEAIEKVHGDKAPSDANTVQGHLDSHAAGCETQTDFGGYMAFRCVKPMNSDKYKNVVEGYTFTNGAGTSDNKNCNDNISNRGEIAARAALIAKENNWNDRSRYHGLLYGKEAGDPSMCSEFGIWCLYQAGAEFGENLMDKDYSRNVLHHSGSKWSYSWMHVAFYRDNPDKGTVYRAGDGYIPQPGDLIIYVDSTHSGSTSQLWDAPIAGFNHTRICVESDSSGKFSWVGGNGTSENYIEYGTSNANNSGASYYIHLNWDKVHGPINRGI